MEIDKEPQEEPTKKSPYEDVQTAFETWWKTSVGKAGRGELTRRDVAEEAYSAGCVLGAEYPELGEIYD